MQCRRGFLALKSIGKQYSNIGTPLQSKTQGVANACIVGAIWCSTFGGRTMKWENIILSQVNQMFENGVDCLICDEHKTSKTYGALAKVVALWCKCSFLIATENCPDTPTSRHSWSQHMLALKYQVFQRHSTPFVIKCCQLNAQSPQST